MSESLQVWVRNDKGQVYGPLTPPSVELLIDNGIIGGRLQVSTNGENYVYPGRVPGLRMIFPRETWGDTVVPGDELDAEWGKVVLPAALPGGLLAGGPPPVSTPSGIGAAPGGPVAGPGVPRGPVAGPGARAPIAGPGPRAHPPGGRPTAANAPPRPPPPAVGSAPSGIRSSPSVADFMSAAVPSGPAVRPPSISLTLNAAPAQPVAPPPPPPRPASSGSGVRAVAAPTGPLDPVELPSSGELATTSAARLYYLAASGDVTGLLTVKLADRELVVHFRKGNPEFLDSTHPEDSLDTFLLSQKLATQAQIDQAQAQAPRFGGDLLPALFGLGLLNPNAVFQHLGQRASQLLFRVLTAEQGSFSFDLEDLPASRAMPLGNKWAVYFEAMRRLSAPDVRRRMMAELELPIMKAGGRVALADVRLTPQETRAHNYFDGVRSLVQLVRDLPGEADVIVRTAWMLAPLELVSFAGVSTTAPKAAPPPAPKIAPPPAVAAPKVSAPVAAPPPAAGAPPKVSAPAPAMPPKINAPAAAPVAPAAPTRPPPPVMAPAAAAPPRAAVPGNPAQPPKPGMAYPGAAQAAAPTRPAPPTMKPAAPASPAAPPEDAAALVAQLEQMKKLTYFEVLGVKRDADANAVKIAYLKAARSYHPDTVPPGSPEALARAKADLFALIGEANRTLSDPKLREEYVGELDAGGSGSKIDIEKLLRAEELFQKGRILVQARKYPDALKLFEEAIACNADEAEFYAWRGYARFLVAPDKKNAQSEVMKDLKHCLAKNPNVSATHYFLGYVAKALGDTAAAKGHFKKCVELDPRHIDAARELRMMK